MQNKRIDLIVGARPNFVKCAVLHGKLIKNNYNVRLIHTGQHYDKAMSGSFFEDLNIPKEDYNLNIGSSSHAEQTARIMMEYEKLLLKEKANMVMVFGDVNSTIASVLTAAKLHIKTAHIEAGLRSYDMDMPEEINRLATDAIADYLLCPGEDAVLNLKKEGHNDNEIFLVGNIMIDTLLAHMDRIDAYDIEKEFNIKEHNYIYLTMHRPSNVDDYDRLLKIIGFLNTIATKYKIVFPIHPRTKKNIEKFGLMNTLDKNIILIEPVSYLKSIKLLKDSFAVITDSGGIQEESSFLGVKCYTLRKNTERPITVQEGTNELIEPYIDIANRIIEKKYSIYNTSIKYWDGKTSDRIIDFLKNNNY